MDKISVADHRGLVAPDSPLAQTQTQTQTHIPLDRGAKPAPSHSAVVVMKPLSGEKKRSSFLFRFFQKLKASCTVNDEESADS